MVRAKVAPDHLDPDKGSVLELKIYTKLLMPSV